MLQAVLSGNTYALVINVWTAHSEIWYPFICLARALPQGTPGSLWLAVFSSNMANSLLNTIQNFPYSFPCHFPSKIKFRCSKSESRESRPLER